MDYERIYNNLIQTARKRNPNELGYYEAHHIVPRSIGGSESLKNIVLLTLKEHRFAHLLLYKIHKQEHPNLVFAVSAMYEDANPERKKFRKICRMPAWIRRAKTLRTAAILREIGRRKAQKGNTTFTRLIYNLDVD